MKKLIVLLLASCAISFANAAACSWSGMGVALQSSSDVATSYAVYLLDASITDSSTMAGYLSKGDMSFMEAATVQTTTGLKAGANMRWNKNGFGNFSAGESFSFYTVIFNGNVSEATHYMITQELTQVSPGTGSLSMSFGSQAGNTWQAMAVPEPTSGLLLVLGIAGLALRRKRA